MRIALVLCALAAPAFAEPNAFLDVTTPPVVTATVYGNPSLETAKCTLSQGELSLAARAAPPAHSTPTIAVVIVVLTDALFGAGVTSDEWKPNDETRPLAAVQAAFDQTQLAKLGAADSTFEIVGYANGARIIQPLRPLAELRGSAFGAAKDYEKQLGNDLVAGIEMGLAELDHARATRKILIVIGDGTDTNTATARIALPELADRARTSHVETYGISMRTELSSPTMVIEDMIDHVHLVNSRAAFAPELSAVTARIGEREAFEFPAESLIWDGLRHHLVFVCPAGLHVEADVTLPAWSPPERPMLPLWLLAGAGIALVVGLIALIGRRHAA